MAAADFTVTGTAIPVDDDNYAEILADHVKAGSPTIFEWRRVSDAENGMLTKCTAAFQFIKADSTFVVIDENDLRTSHQLPLQTS